MASPPGNRPDCFVFLLTFLWNMVVFNRQQVHIISSIKVGHDMQELMTLEEVANYLRVNEKTIYRLLNDGAIPAMKIGHLWRFKVSEINEWLDQKAVKNVKGNKTGILVIDDDATVCSLFKDTLKGMG